MTQDSSSSDPKAPPAADNAYSQALKPMAPGVRSSRQAPPAGGLLQNGEVVGGKFEVERYLGSSDGSVNYLCRDQKHERESVLKLIDLSLLKTQSYDLTETLAQGVRQAAGLGHKGLNKVYGLGQVDQSIFVAMEYIQGASLAKLITQRRSLDRPTPSLRDVYTVVAHLAATLEVLHAAGLVHGVITPYNVFASRSGRLKLANLTVGHVTARALHAQGKGPFFDSIYVAPELREDPEALTPAADVYSVATLTAELLSLTGLPNHRPAALKSIPEVLSGYPAALKQALMSALEGRPSKRPKSLRQLVHELEHVARARGERLGAMPEAFEFPLKPATTDPEEPAAEATAALQDEALFDIPGLTGSALGAEGFVYGMQLDDDEQGRYLVQKQGLDYGPFTKDQVLEQLYADEIDEHTETFDRMTQERRELQEFDALRDPVLAYLPKREQRRREEAARRAELQRKVKQGGVAFLGMGIAVGLVILGVFLYVLFTRPDPIPLPLDQALATLDYKLLPPPKEFQTVAVDQKVMQSIFNPNASEEDIERQIKKLRRKRSAPRKSNRPAAAGGAAPEDENLTVVDMTQKSTTTRILSDGDVNEVILSKWGALRRCVLKEFQSNPRFKGVTVQFFIRPTGTTGGVKIAESTYAGTPLGDCLVSRFRSMTFPSHSGFNRGVTFPLRVQ